MGSYWRWDSRPENDSGYDDCKKRRACSSNGSKLELAEKIRVKYGARRAYDNVDDILADKEIDAIYIASPVIYHSEQAIKAAKAQKHILIEKPAAITVKDGEEILRVCKEEKVLIAVGLMMRFPTTGR